MGLCCKVAVSAAGYAFDRPYTYLVPDGFAQSLRPGMRVLVPFGKGNRRSEGIVLETGQAQDDPRLKWLSALLDEEPVLDREGIQLALWMRERCFCTVYDAVKAMLPAGLYYNLQDTYRLADGVTAEEALARVGQSDGCRRVLELVAAAGGELQRKALCEAFGQTDPSRPLRLLRQEGILVQETSVRRGVGEKHEEIALLALPEEEARAAVEKGRSKLRRAVVELLASVGSASAKDIAYFTGARTKTLRELERMGVVTLFRREVFRRPELDQVRPQPRPQLTPEQQAAYDGLAALQDSGEARCALLYGVTGSGKTSVYLSLIHRTLSLGRSALILVPEIGLTPQLLRQLAGQFGDQVAVLHSSLGAGERYDEWRRARSGEAKVVVGTRSAVFAPLSGLGLIILDEEQESSYKSENIPRYHARDVAKYRCARQKALLVLGSATPSVESMYYAREGRYHLFRLRSRYNRQELPRVLIADLKQGLREGNGSCISQTLREELEANLRAGEQSILFLNRRGSSRMVICSQCGDVPECPRCSVKLTYHRVNQRLMCHYCGHSEPLPDACPQCGGVLSYVGVGTQRVEEELRELFPRVDILRMDADTISATHTHRQMLEHFERERIPILIGTQMVAKGLDFANVTLVGVIDADMALYVDDFRAGERTFSLLTQVVGRAGRGARTGRAVIQTFTPKNEIILTAARQDYDRFFENEITLRALRGFPPFADQYVLTASGPEEGAVLRASLRLRQGLEQWLAGAEWQPGRFELLGPAPANVVKVNGRYRYRLTVSGASGRPLRLLIAQLLCRANEDPANRGVSIYADLNPLD